jgi:hypothetical protein
MELPDFFEAQLLTRKKGRLLIASYGFEDRSLSWSNLQKNQGAILSAALIIKYEPEKGVNKIKEFKQNLTKIGVSYPDELSFNYLDPSNFEKKLVGVLRQINQYEEIVIDVTAMTKYLILVLLCSLENFEGVLRIIYSEAENYSPNIGQFNKFKVDSKTAAGFPSEGFRMIMRAKCLSSIRMQGQPVALVAFTSFNEQLVRNMLGTISPYRLIFINGVPPRADYKWRSEAMQYIHTKLIDEYRNDNELDREGHLKLVASTLYYKETFDVLSYIYGKYGMFERLIIAATGSKMQTVGLYFCKLRFPDVHIEYPTPDSYFFNGMSNGTKKIHEIEIQFFKNFANKFRIAALDNTNQLY